MKHRFAFVGFRHPHVMDMYRRCLDHEDIEVVACCEADPATRSALANGNDVAITHDDYTSMLREVVCDVVAIGDCYGLRAGRILAALSAEKHVICDKPLCIATSELNEIVALAKQQERTVGCMLDMRDHPVYVGMRDALQQDEIGEVHAVNFEGQHPLLYGRRPDWYFEEGMHGGVLNDIAVHALDILPWMTGLRIRTLSAARAWNAMLPQHAHFQQCGQLMLELENGAGVLGDVSYLTPDTFAYAFPGYWRFTLWGATGVLEGSINSSTLTIYRDDGHGAEQLDLPQGLPGAYLDSFLKEVSGNAAGLHLSSHDVVHASRTALRLQEVADQQLSYVTVDW